MVFQPVVDTAEIDIIYSMNGVPVQNTFYAELPNGYVLSDLENLADGIDSQVQGTWKSQQVAEALYVRTEVRGLALENDLVVTDNTNAGPGVFVGAPVPNNVTISIKKVSPFTGRSARGRCFWIGIPHNQLTPANENVLEALYLADVVTAVDSIRVQINTLALWSPVLVSRFTGGLKRAAGKTFPWINSVSVDNVIDSHRGRLPA